MICLYRFDYLIIKPTIIDRKASRVYGIQLEPGTKKDCSN